MSKRTWKNFKRFNQLSEDQLNTEKLHGLWSSILDYPEPINDFGIPYTEYEVSQVLQAMELEIQDIENEMRNLDKDQS